MVAILPTTAELDAALSRLDRAAAARCGRKPHPSVSFEAWCRGFVDYDLSGPHISAGIIGIPDARLLADGFDFAMQQLGSPLRARRVGF